MLTCGRRDEQTNMKNLIPLDTSYVDAYNYVIHIFLKKKKKKKKRRHNKRLILSLEISVTDKQMIIHISALYIYVSPAVMIGRSKLNETSRKSPIEKYLITYIYWPFTTVFPAPDESILRYLLYSGFDPGNTVWKLLLGHQLHSVKQFHARYIYRRIQGNTLIFL